MQNAKNIWVKSVLLILFGLTHSNTNACSCDTVSFEKAVDYADEIFIGKIVKAELFENGSYHYGDEEKFNWDWRYYFKVNRKWKGSSDSELVVSQQGNSCDLYFNINKEEYLVYATYESGEENPVGVSIGSNNGENNLSTWLCSRTIYDGSLPIHNDTVFEKTWYESDVSELNEKFPEKIALSKNYLNGKTLQVVGFAAIILIAFLIGRKTKSK